MSPIAVHETVFPCRSRTDFSGEFAVTRRAELTDVVLRWIADGAISTTGMPWTCAAMSDERLERPTSCAPATTAWAVTAPLDDRSTIMFKPAALKRPALSAYQNGIMSSLGG